MYINFMHSFDIAQGIIVHGFLGHQHQERRYLFFNGREVREYWLGAGSSSSKWSALPTRNCWQHAMGLSSQAPPWTPSPPLLEHHAKKPLPWDFHWYTNTWHSHTKMLAWLKTTKPKKTEEPFGLRVLYHDFFLFVTRLFVEWKALAFGPKVGLRRLFCQLWSSTVKATGGSSIGCSLGVQRINH